MTKWVVTRRYPTYFEMTDTDTGKIKTIRLASDSQWGYYESLRAKYTKKPPLKERPTVFAAAKGIKKLLEKQEKVERQTSLL